MKEFIDIMADCFFTEYEENIAYDKAEKAIADHDKQIRDEVISELRDLFWTRFHSEPIDMCFKELQMKGEQNE